MNSERLYKLSHPNQLHQTVYRGSWQGKVIIS
jgi:hypothetical protein